MAQIEQSIAVNVPVSTAYNQWTQFEDFPRFMEDITEVRQLDDTHLHWVAEIGGKIVEWDAEITEQKPDERVAWKSTSGKPNAGVVTFHRLSDTSCKVMAQMDYETDGIVEKIGSALGADERRVKADLATFKVMVEEHSRMSGGWRGEVDASPGPSPPSDSGTHNDSLATDPLNTPIGPLTPPDENSVSSPDSPEPTDRRPEENPPDRASTPTDPEAQSNPDAPEGKIKEAIQKAKEGFDNLGDQKIGAKIGDDPA